MKIRPVVKSVSRTSPLLETTTEQGHSRYFSAGSEVTNSPLRVKTLTDLASESHTIMLLNLSIARPAGAPNLPISCK